MAGWGICTTCQGVTNSYAGLIVCRTLIGIFEAGYFPGMVYLVSMFYPRAHFQWRLNVLFSASILAGAFSGLLAYGIARMDGLAGYSGWRWIFIIEGAFTVLLAASAIFFVPDWPSTAKFLSDEERQFLLRMSSGEADEFKMDRWNKKTAKRVFSDVKIYLGYANSGFLFDWIFLTSASSGIMFFGGSTSNLGFTFFTPTILRQLGWTSIHAQAMSIPIWLFAAICALITAVLSDRTKHRFWFIIAGCLVTTVGYAIMFAMLDVPVGARYFALFVVLGGGWIAQPITVGWLQNNLSGHYKRGVGSALQIGIGNLRFVRSRLEGRLSI